jgi:hypothetical protein
MFEHRVLCVWAGRRRVGDEWRLARRRSIRVVWTMSLLISQILEMDPHVCVIRAAVRFRSCGDIDEGVQPRAQFAQPSRGPPRSGDPL